MGATFYLNNKSISNRFQLTLVDDNGRTVFIGQPREMKPMCLDELAIMRGLVEKDSSYQRVKDERGYRYIFRARDGHEIGHGDFFKTEQEMNDQIETVKAIGATAEFVDETPPEERIPTTQYIKEESAKLLKEMGIEFG